MSEARYDEGMSTGQRRWRRIAQWAFLALAVVVLGGALAVIVPIVTHQSQGGSGQQVPEGFVSATSAVGADGRKRELAVETPDGEAADLSAVRPGEELVVRGEGFDASIGIYVAICAIPSSAEQRPSPCLGGVPEGVETGDTADGALTSAWVTDDWVWRSFATGGYDDAGEGSFTARIAVPAPTTEGLDCRETRCAIATRADHTAGSDRVQDMLLPVAFSR